MFFLTIYFYYPINFCLSWKNTYQDASKEQQQKNHDHVRTMIYKVISIFKVLLLNI